MRCRYCDTPRSWTARPNAELHLPSGTEALANPMSAAELNGALERLVTAHGAAWAPLSLAVTGGEPLAQAAFLEAWLPQAPAPVLLETAGVYAERLHRVLPQLRYLSLDAKEPAALRAGAELDEAVLCAAAAHREAARRPAERPLEFWTKLIVTRDTDPGWLTGKLEELATAAPGMTVYLQPVTPRAGGPEAPSAEALLQLALRGSALDLELRVLPQIHPLLEMR